MFNGKINYPSHKWAIFNSYVSLPEGNQHIGNLCLDIRSLDETSSQS